MPSLMAFQVTSDVSSENLLLGIFAYLRGRPGREASEKCHASEIQVVHGFAKESPQTAPQFLEPLEFQSSPIERVALSGKNALYSW